MSELSSTVLNFNRSSILVAARPVVAAILLICFAAIIPAAAQVSTGSISGVVKDPSGALVVGAQVTVQNDETGVNQNVKTNPSGSFLLSNLPPGTYKLTVQQAGFRTFQKTGIPVLVSQNNSNTVVLEVGETTSSVSVQASSAAVDTTSSTLGEVVEEKQVHDLPLNGRNFTQLLTLTPGAASTGTTASWGNPQVGTFTMPSINGQSTKSTQWLLDGSNDSSPAFALISVAPVIDDIAEFKIVSHTDSAEYGGVMGGTVDVVTRGGTNELHGGVWDFFRNSALDARNFFRSNVSPLTQNQFGGDVGGPVVLPHYNGRSRTFFFGSYQGFRQHFANAALYRVPTAAQLAGDESGDLPIYNPYSTTPDPNNPGTYTRVPFPNNQIPASLLNPTAEAYAKQLFPTPVNTGFAGTNGIDPRPQITDQDIYTFRVDEQLSRDSISYRYTGVRTPVTSDGGMADATFLQKGRGYNTGINYTHTFAPNILFHAMFAHSWITLDLNEKWNTLDESQFVPQYFSTVFACGFGGGFGSQKCYAPDMMIPGYASVNEFSAHVGQTDIWEFKPDLTVTHGRHEFKMGFNLTIHDLWALTQRDFISFSNTQTADLNNPGVTGSGLASFLLGVPTGADRADAPDSDDPAKVFGVFFQDQWKISSRLTLNLGLRWDAFLPPQYGEKSDGNYYSGLMDLLNGTFIVRGNPGSCATLGKAPCIPTPDGSLPDHVVLAPGGNIYRNVYDNWQPRLGFAYRLSDKTVLRAGVGRFFDQFNETTLAAAQQEGLWPDVRNIVNNLLNQTTVTSGLSNPLALSGSLPAPTPFAITGTWRDPRLKDPLSDQWNVGVTHQFSSATTLTVNYVGSRGRRIPVGGDYNTALTPGPGDPTLRFPYPYITPGTEIRDWGKNWYDSLQVSFNKRFGNGLALLASYTWSKAEDIVDSDGFAGNQPENPYNIWQDKSVSDFNIPQVFSLSSVYALPFGKGKRFSSGNRGVDTVIGDWQLNEILQITSGNPYSIYICGDIANVGRSSCYERPNLVGDPNLSNQSAQGWFNPAAFAAPAQYTYGDLGRNTFRSQPYRNLDLSLFRDFHFGERWKLQFRAEAFNLFNTTTFGTPDNDLTDTNFGKIFSTRSIERQLQLALKLNF